MQYSELLNSQNVKFQFSHVKAEIIIFKIWMISFVLSVFHSHTKVSLSKQK